MTTAATMIATAGRYEGVRESPLGSNRQPFAAMAGHVDGYAWCATFLVAMARQCGLTLPEGASSAYTPSMEAAFKRAGRLSTTPHPGSFGFVYFPSMGRVAHVALVTAVVGDDVLTIEGNSNTDGGREGLEVVRRRRPIGRAPGRTGIRSYGAPLYTVPAVKRPTLSRYLSLGNAGTAVAALQRILRASGHRVTVDSQFGPKTDAALRAWQRTRGLPDDGVVGPRTAKALGWTWTG